MASKKFAANDSQSTREPSQFDDRMQSISASGAGSKILSSAQTMVLSSNSKIGGGSYRDYVLDHLVRLHNDIEQTTSKLELEQRRLYTINEQLKSAETEHATKQDRYKE